MPSRQYWFDGHSSLTVSLPQNPGRLVTMPTLPYIAECVGVGALGFRHADEFPEWLDTPAVAPFWDEFRDNFLLRSPGHLFDPRVECEYIQALFSTISHADARVYSSADTSGRPLNRTNWTPRQHYLRFMCSIAHHHSTSGIMVSNSDIWPNFEDNSRRDPSLSQGYQAWVTLGFLIFREQFNHPSANSANSSPSSSVHGRPRTPDQSRRTLREPTATPEFPMRRVHTRHHDPAPERHHPSVHDMGEGDIYIVVEVIDNHPSRAVSPAPMTPIPTGHASPSPPVSAAANNTTASPSNQERDFGAEMDEILARIDSEQQQLDQMLTLTHPGQASAPAYLSADAVNFSTWQSVLATTIGASNPDNNQQQLPAAPPANLDNIPPSGLVILPTLIPADGVPTDPVRVLAAAGGWTDWYYDRAGLPELTVEYAADGSMVTRLDPDGPMARAAAAERETPRAAAIRAQMQEMFPGNPRPLGDGGVGGGGGGDSGPAGPAGQ